MILEFRVANFRSIRDELVLSFVPDSSPTMRDRVLSVGDARATEALPALVLWGANASGKTNICRAFHALGSTLRSASANRGDTIPNIEPFRLNAATAGQPTRFSVEFIAGGDAWQYELNLTAHTSTREVLKRRSSEPRSRWATVFERDGTDRSKWVGRAPRLSASFFESVRDNATILSKASQENIEAVQAPYDALSQCESYALGFPDLRLNLQTLVDHAKVSMETVSNLVRVADLVTGQASLEKLRPEPDASTRFDGFGLTLPDPHELVITASRDDGSPLRFGLDELSRGTQTYVRTILLILGTLQKGGLLVLDEVDNSLHPNLLDSMLGLLADPDLNPHEAQFVFATHDSSLLDPKRFRLDQIVIVNREEPNGTEAYPLSDVRPRPRLEDALERRYLRGAYGGTPRIRDVRQVVLETVIPAVPTGG